MRQFDASGTDGLTLQWKNENAPFQVPIRNIQMFVECILSKLFWAAWQRIEQTKENCLTSPDKLQSVEPIAGSALDVGHSATSLRVFVPLAARATAVPAATSFCPVEFFTQGRQSQK